MTLLSLTEKILQKSKEDLDSTLHNSFNKLPDSFQNTLDFFVRDVQRAATLVAARMKQKELYVGELTWHYIESYNNDNRKKETLLCLHGFSDNKFSFAFLARELIKNYHIISIDLPGFGDSDKPSNSRYSLQKYQDWVLEFIKAKKITNCHIMGNSLGGAIAASIAADHPELFKSITLIGAAGVMDEEPVGVYKMVQEGKNVFAVKNMEDFNHLMHTVFRKPPPLPFLIKHYRLRKYLANREWYNKVLDELMEGLLTESFDLKTFDRSVLLNEKIKKINKPVLLLWGDNDQLCPPILGELFHELIKNSKYVEMKNTGHLPQIESPKYLAREFEKFVSELAL
jgi:abhydrolase domain-containing protein 6